MSTDSGNLELGFLSEAQRKFFEIPDSGAVTTNFLLPDEKLVWYSRTQRIADANLIGREYKLDVDKSFDFLVSSTLMQLLPGVKVKDEFAEMVEIALCHNAGHNVYVKLTFSAGTFNYTIDSVWLDKYLQWVAYHQPHKLYHYNKCIGNISRLTSWSSSLPESEINLLIPFFYSDSPGCSFPLFLVDRENRNTKVQHTLVPRGTTLGCILRMRIKGDDGKWTEIPPDSKYLEGGFPVLSTPKFENEYGKMDPNDRNRVMECLQKFPPVKDPTSSEDIVYSLYYREVYIPDPSEMTSKYKPGDTCCSKPTSISPTLAFFWSLVDLEYQATNNFSNYTTHPSTEDGVSPADNFSLIYNDHPKVENMSCTAFSKAEASRRTFPSAPYEEGYHVYSHSMNPLAECAEVGVIHGNLGAMLNCTLRTDIPSNGKERKFALLVRHLRLRSFGINQSGKIVMLS